MDAFGATVTLLTGLAWPIVTFAIAWIFRAEIRIVLRSRNARLKAGPLELALEQAKVEAEAALATPAVAPDGTVQSTASPVGGLLGIEPALVPLVDVAVRNPLEAMMRAYGILEGTLRDRARDAGIESTDRSAVQLAAQAANERVITHQSVNSLQGVAVLRNLAVHAPPGDIDTETAHDFLRLVEATIYAIRQTPR